MDEDKEKLVNDPSKRISADRLKDIAARLALAIQRAGGDHLGGSETLHQDLIELLSDHKELKDIAKRTLELCNRMSLDLHETDEARISALKDTHSTLKALIAAKERINELEALNANKLKIELEAARKQIASLEAILSVQQLRSL